MRIRLCTSHRHHLSKIRKEITWVSFSLRGSILFPYLDVFPSQCLLQTSGLSRNVARKNS